MEKEQVIQVMAMIGLEYQNFQMSEERLELWVNILNDLDFEYAKRAVVEWLSGDHEWPPKVGELRTLANDIRRSDIDRERRRRDEAEKDEQRRLEALRPTPTAGEIEAEKQRHLENRKTLRALIQKAFPNIRFEKELA